MSKAGSHRSASKVVERKKFSVVMSPGKHSYRASCPQERNFEQYIQVDKETLRARPEASIPKPLYNQSGPVETKPFVNPGHPIFNEWREPRGRHINDVEATSKFAHFRPGRTNSDYVAGDSRVLNDHIFQTYLDRQNRKEYINRASQMSFNGDNIAFVFFKNQIQKLMNQCPIIERRLEVLRATCVGQPREMVNLFFGPMRGLSTSERVDKALERLSEKYGVPGSLTAEPAIVDIRNGSRVLHNVVSLKKFREDLNTLEVFAYVHNEIEKLSGQLLLDVANRLSGVLKRRYLDYLNHLGLDLNKPGFDSLRNFVGHELKIMTSEYAQTFFKQNKKSGEFGNSRNTVHVRQSVVQSNDAKSQTVLSKAESSKSNGFNSNRKLPPVCFYCNDTSLKHYLGECEKFKKLGLERRRQVVIEARRCLNCFGLGHFARNCGFASKCRKCGPICHLKHATALHDLYVRSSSVDFKVTNTKESVNACDFPSSSEENKHVVARKICPSNKIVLLRTCAVKVINPRTGRFTLAYAQHDTAS